MAALIFILLQIVVCQLKCRHAEMASLSFPVFVILSLAPQIHFFPPSSTVNTVSAVSYTIRWHQRKQSSMCPVGRNHPLVANLWQVHSSAIFTLSNGVSRGWGDTMGLPWWEQRSNWVAVASMLEEKEPLCDLWVILPSERWERIPRVDCLYL